MWLPPDNSLPNWIKYLNASDSVRVHDGCVDDGCAAAKERPIPVKVVVVTMLERGADTGDEPGEFQYWLERDKLDRVLSFPQGYHDLRMNRGGVLGILTGIGTAKAAASIMALGLDGRFDLRKAYWLVAGIAGIDRLAWVGGLGGVGCGRRSRSRD
jgi:purine nucleoside permease